MELLLGWHETQLQDVLVSHTTSDGTDYYECWEPQVVTTSPYGYKRTFQFSNKQDAWNWCEKNSDENSHYIVWNVDENEWEAVRKKYPELEKWYYD